MIELTQPIFLLFVAGATGASYWFGKKEGHNQAIHDIVQDLIENGFIDRDGIFIEKSEREDKES